MPPVTSLRSWWTAHLQLPGYDPIATAGACHVDFRAAEQVLVLVTQTLPSPLSPWEEAIVLNLWGWRQADGQRRYATVYAEPYRQDALAPWCATLGLLLLCMAPPRRAPQVTVAYAQGTLAAEAYTHVVAAIALGRPRARSIAGLFSRSPSEPDVRLIASSGSPVSLSRRPWPILVDVLMTPFAHGYTFALSVDHNFHPCWNLPFALFVQVF